MPAPRITSLGQTFDHHGQLRGSHLRSIISACPDTRAERQMLLEALPDRRHLRRRHPFRGGLVLRTSWSAHSSSVISSRRSSSVARCWWRRPTTGRRSPRRSAGTKRSGGWRTCSSCFRTTSRGSGVCCQWPELAGQSCVGRPSGLHSMDAEGTSSPRSAEPVRLLTPTRRWSPIRANRPDASTTARPRNRWVLLVRERPGCSIRGWLADRSLRRDVHSGDTNRMLRPWWQPGQ